MNVNELNINQSSGTTIASFVLVHAAWQGPYAWNSVQAQLLQAGFSVEVIQLPGHGTDFTEPQSLSMDSYISHVADAILAIGRKVILVGHSLAGMIISGVSEKIPELVDKLVYIAAYVPEDGQSAYAISLLDKQSLLEASLIVSEDQAEFDIRKDDITNIFCQDGSDDVKQLILENYRREPAAPFSDAVVLNTGRFGGVPKFYIETLQDHGIGNNLQKEMIRTAKIQHVFSLNTGHTPALSAPEDVVRILANIANER